MKKLFFILTLLLGNRLYAGILPDANTLVLSKILAQGISQIQKMQRTYEKITEFTQISQQTRNEISSLLKLESDTRNALLLAKNIKDLKVSDIKYFLNQSFNVKGNIDDYSIPGSFINQIFHQINSKSLDSKWGIQLYNGIHMPEGLSISPYTNTFGNKPGNLDLTKNIYDQIGLESYIQDQNSRIFQMMQNYASRYEEQAMEMEELIKTDNLYSMNTSERMNLMIQAGNLIEKAVRLRIEANHILESKPGETLQAQNKALELVQSQKDLSNRINLSKRYAQVFNP